MKEEYTLKLDHRRNVFRYYGTLYYRGMVIEAELRADTLIGIRSKAKRTARRHAKEMKISETKTGGVIPIDTRRLPWYPRWWKREGKT